VEAFLCHLIQCSFADEFSFVSACLSEEERKKLTQQVEKLKNEHHKLEVLLAEKSAYLESERQREVTDLPNEQLTTVRDNLQSRLKHLQQEISTITVRLQDNQRIKCSQQEKLQAIEAQKRECARWDTLNKLIGSSDGKRYRNFVQGLTFEMLIGHANRQLQKMSDRYLLVRDSEQPLELNVIDNYQGGRSRTTKNLSGGEGFIVSLSLALGLSHMASKNVRVDSLFLVEGFGTLDDEALDTALATLSSLQQDGKLIIVISHVPALKERITTQIRVIPQASGTSIIRGPGCSKKDKEGTNTK
jgi:exonuclease SbcC